MPRLILASASPRRRDLLGLAGYKLEVVPAGIEELTEGDAAELVIANARRKAETVAAEGGATDDLPVLGVDTDVVIDGRLLGKPEGEDAARECIELLSGRSHTVLSGVVLIGSDRTLSELVGTEVGFRELSAADVDSYVASGEWRDRAGGYAVQGLGSSLVAAIDGDLSNVIGLPLPAVAEMVAILQES
jgi:nucleoside triphosphate pyrophosphatase